MVGALLHQDITGLEVNLGFVEQHVDLARHDHRIVHGAGAVHGRVPRRQTALGRAIPQALMHAGGIEISHLRRLRGKIHNAKYAAAAGRHDADLDCGAIGATG